MPTNFIGHGVTFAVQIGTVYTVLGACQSITLPDIDVTEVDVTKLSSNSKVTRAGLPDPGKCDVELQFDPADTTAQTLFTLAATVPQTDSNFKVTYTDGSNTTLIFPGYVKTVGYGDVKPEDLIVVKATIRLTDIPTLS